MSWMSRLFETYEENIEKGQQSDMELTPIAHIYANAQVEIILDINGRFQSAQPIEKKESVTLIPVTEASASRSSGVSPHALCDTLSYIAGDFSIYCEDKKQKDSAEKKHQAYITGLEKWERSKCTHPKIQAIFRYLFEDTTISDLIKAGLIGLSERGVFDKKKISGQSYEKALVRFRVLGDGEATGATWSDASLIQSYIKYYLEGQQGKTDICYFTGKEKIISELHPKGILVSDYGAKLVSANDKQGYTYRGRFQNAGQAYALSYEASQKIHGALTWLAKRQGVSIGSQDKRTFICWNPEGKKTPDIFGELGLGEDEEVQDTQINYRKRLWKTLQGYQDQFDDTDPIIVMALDAATTGRLSVTYYHELMASDFLGRILEWGQTCNWVFLRFDAQKRPYQAIETPIFRRIVECAFGREKENFIQADDKVMKEQTQRLMKCMLEKQRIPFDLVHALFIRASTPMAYSRINRERVLSTACAVIRKYHYEKGAERQDDMRLDTENRDRSYLFGRLLAIYENAERITYDKGEQRDPNAIRLQSAYVNHPMQTWKTLQELLNPYLQKLTPGMREYYRKMISEIVALFKEEDEDRLNQGLQETYLLGYYLQRAELYKKKEA